MQPDPLSMTTGWLYMTSASMLSEWTAWVEYRGVERCALVEFQVNIHLEIDEIFLVRKLWSGLTTTASKTIQTADSRFWSLDKLFVMKNICSRNRCVNRLSSVHLKRRSSVFSFFNFRPRYTDAMSAAAAVQNKTKATTARAWRNENFIALQQNCRNCFTFIWSNRWTLWKLINWLIAFVNERKFYFLDQCRIRWLFANWWPTAVLSSVCSLLLTKPWPSSEMFILWNCVLSRLNVAPVTLNRSACMLRVGVLSDLDWSLKSRPPKDEETRLSTQLFICLLRTVTLCVYVGQWPHDDGHRQQIRF